MRALIWHGPRSITLEQIPDAYVHPALSAQRRAAQIADAMFPKFRRRAR
ncbi:MAG TPA: hypothetical protein VEP50_13215 [bacterium]|nr:hypothetical protein [bacterium]